MKQVKVNNHSVTINGEFCNLTELGKALNKPFIDWYMDNAVFIAELAYVYQTGLNDLIQTDYSKPIPESWGHRIIVDEFALNTGNHALIMTELSI